MITVYERGAIRITVDETTGAIYVRVRDGKVDHTDETLGVDVNIDLTADDELVGVEVLT